MICFGYSKLRFSGNLNPIDKWIEHKLNQAGFSSFYPKVLPYLMIFSKFQRALLAFSKSSNMKNTFWEKFKKTLQLMFHSLLHGTSKTRKSKFHITNHYFVMTFLKWQDRWAFLAKHLTFIKLEY